MPTPEAHLGHCPDAILFDFDGVIVESADIKTAAFRALYRPYGEAVVDRVVAHHRAHGGISRRQKIRHCHLTFLATTLSRPELDALCRQFSAAVEDEVVAAPLVAGAAAALATLAARRPLFIVSGTPEDELTRIVERRNLGQYFTGVYGSPPEKPPIIREILRRHGLRPQRVWFIGDAMTDHDAAVETGLSFIGRIAADGWNPFPAGTRLIRDLTELPVDRVLALAEDNTGGEEDDPLRLHASTEPAPSADLSRREGRHSADGAGRPTQRRPTERGFPSA